ncbi:uncharacterized protein [Magallana gigas]|uniref:uncharacterized protein n=1 Tax=Magallana gigas TaxID=29159 RepID=UPI00333FC2AD
MNNMTYSLVWSALLSLISQASSQNVQIQAIPQTVTLRENDLVVLCSITNPSQLASLFFIQLSKNASGNFTTVVSVASGNKLLWADSTLYNRGAIASGSISTKSTPQLRFTILKDIVRCPDDFKLYKCKMSGFDLQSNAFESETMPITITYNIKPNVIEMPRVRILGETNDTPNRQFSIGTVIEITCEGQIGSDPSNTIGWCAKRASELSFITLANTPIHSDATPLGCQYTRSSTITYNLTNYDTFTRFLCESGDTGTCGTGTAIQYVNITIVRPTLIVKVRIMNDHNDTTKRQFPVGTVLQITCQGQIGSDPNKTIGWCIQKKNEPSFTRLSQTPLHSDAGNQSSTITYNLTSEDIFTRFLCESGDTGLCGTGTAIQYVNISTTGTEGSSTTSAPSTDDGNMDSEKYINVLDESLWRVIAKYFTDKPYMF